MFQLVSTKPQLITTSIRFQGSTILRLWNPRSNDSNRIRTNLERLTLHNFGTGPIRLRSSDDSPLYYGTGPIRLRSSDDWPFYYGTGPIRLRSSDDWPRRPRVSCLYAFQIGAQCQRPYFPPFLFHPGWLSIERAAKYLPTFSAPALPSLH